MKQRIIALITFISMMLGIIPVIIATASAEAVENPYNKVELYSIELTKDACIVHGRWYGDSDDVLSVKAYALDGTAESQGAPLSSDGSFSLQFETEYVSYRIEVSGPDGDSAEQEINLADYAELFTKQSDSFVIDSFTIEKERVIVRGTHNGAASADVTMRTVDSENPTSLDGITALRQVKSDENKSFEVRAQINPGDMIMYFMSKGLTEASYNIRLSDYENLTVSDDSYEFLTGKLNSMLSILDTLANRCKEKGIATDYADVNRGIIRKFITNIKTEAEHGSYERMSQYNYALTKLYLEAYDDMTGSLSGEKKALSVPRYKSGDISLDGTGIIATTETDGVTGQSNVFFTGFCGWDNAAEEIPFLSEIGFNSIQTEIKMYDVLVEDNIYGWGVRTFSEPEYMFSVIDSAAATGEHSLHIDGTSESPDGSYKYIFCEVDVEPNTSYQYGFMGKGSINADKAIHLNLNGLRGNGRKYAESSENWKSYDYEYKTGENQTSATLVLLAEGTADYYVDDIYIRKSGTSGNLLVNGDFETFGTKTEFDIEAEALGLYINYERIGWLREVLKTAEEYGVMVDLSVCPYYLPYYVRERNGVEDGGRGFTNYSLKSETVKKVLSLWSRLLVSVAEDYSSVKSLCLMGEPEVHANLTSHYNEDWTKYLEELYGSVEKLNEQYGGTTYKSFAEVDMPRDVKADGTIGTDVYKIYRTPLYYDYICFNDKLLAGFIEWFATEIKAVNKDLYLHVKYMEYFRNDYRRYLNQGTNWELISGHLDVNGCDAHSYYEHPEKTPLTLKMANYDFMTSVKDAPVWDSESHVIDDPGVVTEDGFKTPVYSEKIRRHIEADTWNGAVHGGTSRQYWLWDIHNLSLPWGSRNNQNSNFAMRPEELAAMGRTSLDLMRLSEEVTALQKAERKSAILYSRTSSGYSESSVLNPYMQSIQAAYEELIFSGQRVGFVTDSDPSAMMDYELLVIPEATNVSAEMLSCIKAFIQSGKTVMLQGEGLLAYDEYNRAHDADVLEFIYDSAIINGDISATVRELGLSEIELIDVETGEYPGKVEWIYSKTDDGYLVNVMNYDEDEAVNLKLCLNGKEVSDITELRKEESIEALAAEPMSPILLSVGDNAFDLTDESGNVIKGNITKLQQGIIRCNIEADGTLLLALYKDNKLIKITKDTNTISFSETDKGSYRLSAMDWDMVSMKPLRKSREITMEVE